MKKVCLIYLIKPTKGIMFLGGDQNPLLAITYSKGKFYCPDMDYDETPLMYFKMLWNDKLIELIAKQTNIFSFQKLGKTIQVTKEGNSTIHQYSNVHSYFKTTCISFILV